MRQRGWSRGRGPGSGRPELVTRLQADGLADMMAGSVYPVLTRLEHDGHITSRLDASSSGPARKYYVPTISGDAELTRSTRSCSS